MTLRDTVYDTTLTDTCEKRLKLLKSFATPITRSNI